MNGLRDFSITLFWPVGQICGEIKNLAQEKLLLFSSISGALKIKTRQKHLLFVSEARKRLSTRKLKLRICVKI
jgi:hypothetical protein